MNKKMFCAILTLSASLVGQELDLSFLKELEAKAEESTSINLGKEQLQLIKGLSGGAVGGELQALAGNIELVQVKVLEFDKDGMFKMSDMEALRDKVKASDVVPVMTVKERDGFTEIFMRKGPKGNRGFVILAAEKRELTIVNIVGEIDLASLAKLGGKFGIPNVILENQGSKGKSKSADGNPPRAKDDEQ
jgi:hypothetical protein